MTTFKENEVIEYDVILTHEEITYLLQLLKCDKDNHDGLWDDLRERLLNVTERKKETEG